MEGLAVVLVYGIVAAVAYRWRDRTFDGVVESLCLTCVNAVITRGTRGEEWVACNLGGALRPVKFTVRECTGHCSSHSSGKLVTIEGFAPESRDVYAEVAIS
jgi:hypothetical protein